MRLSLIFSAFKSLWWWLNHFLVSKNTKGHGIHSPAVYEFVTCVVRPQKLSDQIFLVENYIKQLEKDSSEVNIEELGAGSRTMSHSTRKVSDIVKVAGCSRKQGRLLHRIVAYYKPSKILELGTSVGKSVFYMASANFNASITTIDANKSVLDIAKKGAEELKLNQINFIEANFDNVLQKFLESSLDMVYIDGNHSFEGTMRYFKEISGAMSKGIIVLDDIYWSSGMKRAWKEIQQVSTCSIDLYWMGIVLIDELLTPGTYSIRF